MRLNTPQILAAVIRDQQKTQQLTQKETADWKHFLPLSS